MSHYLKTVDEKQWFEKQIQIHENEIKSYLQKKYGLSSEVDDILQEAYIRIINKYRSETILYPRALLHAMSRNIAVDYLRRNKILFFEELGEVDSPDIVTDANIIQQAASFNERSAIVQDAIEALPSKCREIFLLKKIKQYSLKQIALELGLSVRTVETQISIGIKRCRNYFEKYEREMRDEGTV